MKQDKSKNSVPMLVVLGFILTAIGSQGAWISLPLSGSSPELVAELASYAVLIDLYRWLFFITIVMAGVCSILRYQQLSILITIISLLIIVSFVVYGLFQDHQLVLDYMNQSLEREALQSFISNNYWPNINPDHTVNLITEYEYLWQRIIINWNIIGSGCKTAFFGGLIILLGSLVNVRMMIPLFIIAVLFFTGTTIVVAPLIRAENIHHTADILLETGRHQEALNAYEEAVSLDPMLEYSAPFLRKISRVYYRLEGEHSMLASLYLLHTAISGFDEQVSESVLINKIKRAHLLINNSRLVTDKTTALQKAVITQSYKEDATSWITLGLLEYESGALIESLRSFHEALRKDASTVHVKYFIAHVLLKLQRRKDAMEYLKSALPSVWNNQLRADILCTMGEVYVQSNEPLLARQAFTSCYELDEVYNYRAVKLLSGT